MDGQTLEQHEGLAQLVPMLALSERFHAHILICEGPRHASDVLAYIMGRVEASRGAPVRCVQLNPHDGWEKEQVDYERLVDAVLKPLVAPSPVMLEPETIVVLNATAARAGELDAWALVFRRMNEQRNVIGSSMRSALLICLPSFGGDLFARAAPDFWSIRSSMVRVVESNAEGRGISRLFPPGDAYTTLSQNNLDVDRSPERLAQDLAEIDAEIAKCRDWIADALDDVSRLGGLAIWLDRRIQLDLQNGRPKQELLEERAAIGQRIATSARANRFWQRKEVIRLRREAAAHFEQDDHSSALSRIDEGIALARSVVVAEPKDWFTQMQLARCLQTRARLRLKTKERDEAPADFDEARKVCRRLVEEQLGVPEVFDTLAHGISVEAHAYRRVLRDVDRALVLAQESLDIRRELFTAWPEDPERRRGLWESLECMGDVLEANGRRENALVIYEEARNLACKLVEQSPKAKADRELLASSLMDIGLAHLGRMSIPPAVEALESGVSLWRDLVREYPEDPALPLRLYAGQSLLSFVCLIRGDKAQARMFLDEGLGGSQTMLALKPDNERAAMAVVLGLNSLMLSDMMDDNIPKVLARLEEIQAHLRNLLAKDVDDAAIVIVDSIVSAAMTGLAVLHDKSESAEEALDERLNAVHSAIVKHDEKNKDTALCLIKFLQSAIALDRSQPLKAMQLLSEASELAKGLVEQTPNSPFARFVLAAVSGLRAMMADAQRDDASALQAWRDTYESLKGLPPLDRFESVREAGLLHCERRIARLERLPYALFSESDSDDEPPITV